MIASEFIIYTMSGEEDTRRRSGAEEEPLLGEPGDAAQREEKGIQFNLVIGKRQCLSLDSVAETLIVLLGTAVIAQAGIWIVCTFRPYILISSVR